MVSKVERLHVYLPNFWVEVPASHEKKPPPLPHFSGGEQIDFTVPPPNQLLTPFLSTPRSGDFRNGLKSRKRECLPSQILRWSADNPMGKKALPLPQFSGGEKINFTVPAPNQLLTPVLSTSRSGEFRTGLKNRKMLCLPTQISYWKSCDPMEKKWKIGAKVGSSQDLDK